MACQSTSRRTFVAVFLLFSLILLFSSATEGAKDDKDKAQPKKKDESWKKKNIRDYSEADLEKLFDQWEEDEDPLEEDEKPEWERTPPAVDMSQFDPQNPEKILEASKKGRTLMLFASVSGSPTEKETETVTGLWQTSLHNANVETQRFVVGDNRVIFMLKDGSKAWFVKDFLVTQERCSEVTIEGKNYPGKGAEPQEESEESNKTTKKSEKENEKPKKKSKNDIKKNKQEKTEL